jgi:hypothetical protein
MLADNHEFQIWNVVRRIAGISVEDVDSAHPYQLWLGATAQQWH